MILNEYQIFFPLFLKKTRIYKVLEVNEDRNKVKESKYATLLYERGPGSKFRKLLELSLAQCGRTLLK